MKKTSLLLLAACLALAACQPAATALPTAAVLAPTSRPTLLPTATATLPAPSATPAPVRPGGVTDLAAAAACDVLPGLAGCPEAAAGALSGRLALIVSRDGLPALLAADLKTGTAWQVASLPAAVQSLKWSPSGKALAVFLANGQEQTYLADGTFSGTNPLAPSAAWNAQDQLALDPYPVAAAANGDRAWVDFNTALAYIERAAEPGKQVTWPLETPKSDKIYRAIAWVPGSDLVLCGYTQGGGSAMLLGPSLLTLDAKTGATRSLQTSLRASFQMAWQPGQPGMLLLAETGTHELMSGQRLALLNVLTGQKSYPLPNQQASISWPAFTPDGKSAIFGSYLPPEQAGPGHPLGALAIYRVTLSSGELARLTTPPAGAQDNRPQLLADGVHFIYYRLSMADPASLTARLGSLDGSLDQPLAGPLAAPECLAGPGDCAWESIIAASW